MKRIAILLVFFGHATSAQEAEDPPGPIERRIEELFRDLFSEIEPQLRELRDSIGNLDQYEAPEMLPNGDIIIRRKAPLAPAPPETEDEPEIEEDGDGAIEI